MQIKKKINQEFREIAGWNADCQMNQTLLQMHDITFLKGMGKKGTITDQRGEVTMKARRHWLNWLLGQETLIGKLVISK